MSTNKNNLLNSSNVKCILHYIKPYSKKLYYETYNTKLHKTDNGYFKTALDLSFDSLYEHQINNIMGEINHLSIFKAGKMSAEDVIILQQAYINEHDLECSTQRLLLYLVNIACRRALIEYLDGYSKYAAS